MEELFLDVELRKDTGRGKVHDLRDGGFIPAVIYGGGKSASSIMVSHKQLFQFLHQHRLENVIISLRIKGDEKKSRVCLIKEIQYHPVKGDIVHVDFNEVSLTKVLKVNVPVVAKGEPIGVKQEGGLLEHHLWEIEIECLPTDMPKDIEIDVSALKLNDTIHVRDLKLSAALKVLNDPNSLVLSVVTPVQEVVAPVEDVEGEVKQEPEVIKEKKPVAEGKEGEVKEKK